MHASNCANSGTMQCSQPDMHCCNHRTIEAARTVISVLTDDVKGGDEVLDEAALLQ